ncbi:PRM1 [[Candida] subhashii]|uniref:Plasma membrane fusion protein PRM1 n=1 Tax=[Candida] subhashii TaxID=561895 RepID=A0A8J5QSW8_9ASCO|nr:PRM1 [[Candida] subhashii]KAG7665430.1 PRM1 [[Candida] subhashii]
MLKNSLISNITKNIIDESACDDDNIQPMLDTMHKLVIDGMNKLQYSSVAFVIIIVKTIQQLILFYIEIFVGTYLCLLNAVMKTTTEFALDSGETIIRTLNVTIVEVTNEIEEGLQGLSTLLNDFSRGITGLASIFTGESTDPSAYEDKIKLSLGSLKDKIMIPGDVLTKIDEVRNTSLDGISQVDSGTQTLISAPFNLATEQLTKLKDNSNWNSGVKSVDPLQAREICLENVSNSIEYQQALINGINYTSKILIISLILGMIGCAMVFFYLEWRHWKRTDAFLSEASVVDKVGFRNQSNIYEDVVLYSLIKRFGISVSDKAIWMWSYLTSKFARNVLCFGFMGLLAFLIQYILIKEAQNSLQNRIDTLQFDNSTVSGNVTDTYLKNMNTYISESETTLNDELFGSIKETSETVHQHLLDFLETLSSTLDSIFGNTPFSGPIETVVYCTLGRKLEKVEQGLDWINNNLYVKFPEVSPELEQNIKELKFSTSNKVLDKVKDILDIYRKSLNFELYVSLAFLGAWVLQIIIGGLILFLRRFQWTDDDENSELTISDPRPLTKRERETYGYPVSQAIDTNMHPLPHPPSIYSSSYSPRGTDGYYHFK